MAAKTKAHKPLEDDMETLRTSVTLTEETEENVESLTKALDAVGTKKDIAVVELRPRLRLRVPPWKLLISKTSTSSCQPFMKDMMVCGLPP